MGVGGVGGVRVRWEERVQAQAQTQTQILTFQKLLPRLPGAESGDAPFHGRVSRPFEVARTLVYLFESRETLTCCSHLSSR